MTSDMTSVPVNDGRDRLAVEYWPLTRTPGLIVPFKKQAYLEVVTAFRDLPQKLRRK